MADTELSSKLYEKMSAEQDKFRAWLVEQPPADILLPALDLFQMEQGGTVNKVHSFQLSLRLHFHLDSLLHRLFHT